MFIFGLAFVSLKWCRNWRESGLGIVVVLWRCLGNK